MRTPRRFIIVLLGVPGSGKSTQAKLLALRPGFERISTGDLLRGVQTQDTPAGREIRALLAAGEIVPDRLVTPLLEARMAASQPTPVEMRAYPSSVTVLDGYPRLHAQLAYLDRIERPERVHAIYLHLSDEVATRRLLERDDARDDDTPEIIAERLRQFHGQIDPITAYYQPHRLHSIDADVPLEVVAKAVTATVDSIIAAEDIYQA